jgi:predicted metal-dependent phosphoesterase TrpH
MIIDTHLHESKYSGDSHISLLELVVRAKEIGLDGICITDHESNEIMEEAHELAQKIDFTIIVGAEFLTHEGDMTVFGLKELPKEKIHAHELIELVNKNGGVAVCSHPYRQNNRGMGDHIRDLKNVWGIEAFNGSTPPHHNLQAYNLSLELGVPALGGSDAHNWQQVGKYATVFPDGVKTEKDLIEAIKLKQVCPVYYENGHYKKVDDYYKKLKRIG